MTIRFANIRVGRNCDRYVVTGKLPINENSMTIQFMDNSRLKVRSVIVEMFSQTLSERVYALVLRAAAKSCFSGARIG
jgi:hypothetical protein